MARVRLPVRSVRGNVLVATSPSDAWAVYALRSFSYRAEPERRKAALAAELEAYAGAAEADFQILRVSRRFDPDAYVEGLRREVSTSHRNALNRYLERQRHVLLGLESWVPSVFLCVSLSDPGRDLQTRASHAFEQTPREAWSALRQRGAPLARADLRSRVAVAEARVLTFLDARPASAREVQWLIRRAYRRALPEPELASEGDGETGRWFTEDGVEHRHRYLRVDGEYGEAWQAGLVLGEVDDAEPFTRGIELMSTPLEDHAFPVDASLCVRWVANEQARRQLRTQFQRSSNQRDDEEEHSYGAMGDSHDRVGLAREYYDRLTRTKEPMLRGTLSFVVAGTSREELETRVAAVRRAYPWPLYRPYGDQLDVWLQHLPGQRTRVRGFERPFTPQQVGAMVPHATHVAGSEGGRAFYVARTTHGSTPTLLDLREGSRTNRPPTIALIGTLGGGKSIALQLLEYQAFLQGARIVDVDPKGDHRFHLLPEVAPHVREIVLGPSPEHAGRLDPLRIAPEGERHDAAATFLIDVLPRVDGEVETAINGAITRVLETHGPRACCREVVGVLIDSANGEEQKAGRMLASYAEGGLSQLGFARLDDPLPSRADEQVTYLQIRALKRADVKTVRSEMSQSQRHGRAVLQLVALYAMKILGEERDRLKVLAFDEASFLTQDAVGHQLLDTLNRWARSELAVPIVSSQLLGDVADQDNLIGWWFLFAMRSRDHARRALVMLEQDPDGPLTTALVERYGTGRALCRDLQNRCEEVQIDLGDPELLAALSTTPTEEEPEESTSELDEVVARLAVAE